MTDAFEPRFKGIWVSDFPSLENGQTATPQTVTWNSPAFQHCRGTPCTPETHDFKAFQPDFNRTFTGFSLDSTESGLKQFYPLLARPHVPGADWSHGSLRPFGADEDQP